MELATWLETQGGIAVNPTRQILFERERVKSSSMSLLPIIDRVRSEKDMRFLNSKLAIVSTKKISPLNEIQQIKGVYENQCFKKGSKQKKAERQARVKLEQYNWTKWLLKRNGKPTPRLTKREFKVFRAWYSSRKVVNGSQHEELGGIRLDHVAHDFVKIGLFDNCSDATTFLKKVDADDSGFISFAELMDALGDASSESQVACMRKFVASLTEKQDTRDSKKIAREALAMQNNSAIRRSASKAEDADGSLAVVKLPSISKKR